jgi:hypothetical protein
MQYLRGWRALRRDPEWVKKIAIASFILFIGAFIPILGQVVLAGWSALALRRAVSGQDAPLPRLDLDFNYLGKLLSTGFKGFLAQLLWSLPLVAVLAMGLCCFYAGMVALALGVNGAGGSDESIGIVLACVVGVCILVMPFVIVVLSAPVHVANMRAELTDDISSAMRFKDVLEMTKLLMKELVIGQFVLMALGIAAVVFGVLTLYIGMFPAAAVLQVIHTYWLAEVYSRYLAKGGQPLPIGPLDVEGGNYPQRPADSPHAF